MVGEVNNLPISESFCVIATLLVSVIIDSSRSPFPFFSIWSSICRCAGHVLLSLARGAEISIWIQRNWYNIKKIYINNMLWETISNITKRENLERLRCRRGENEGRMTEYWSSSSCAQEAESFGKISQGDKKADGNMWRKCPCQYTERDKICYLLNVRINIGGHCKSNFSKHYGTK